jgi:phosphoribosylformimino-5-aminoimidazole carboxamide ribotide isomerase
MILFPAIDLIAGKCVRLRQGLFTEQTSYANTPLELAQLWENQGATHLHLVDLDGARAGSPQHLSVLEELSSKTKLKIDFGGGLKSRADIQSALGAGADKLNIGSLAVKNRELFTDLLSEFKNKIILSVDTRKGLVAFDGWQSDSVILGTDFLSSFVDLDFYSATDVERDGTLEGPNLDLYSSFIKAKPELKCIASGGVSSLQDLLELKKVGVYGVIVGKALLEDKFSLENALKIVDIETKSQKALL